MKIGTGFCLLHIRYNGKPKVMKITACPELTERKNNYGPFDLPAAHIFKIRNGKLYEIEAIGYMGQNTELKTVGE